MQAIWAQAEVSIEGEFIIRADVTSMLIQAQKRAGRKAECKICEYLHLISDQIANLQGQIR
jgi:hypothetical protein